jgi:hypothetical protein
MSELGLWNSDKKEGPDMSDQSLWNPARGSDMSDLTGVFDGMVDF